MSKGYNHIEIGTAVHTGPHNNLPMTGMGWWWLLVVAGVALVIAGTFVKGVWDALADSNE